MNLDWAMLPATDVQLPEHVSGWLDLVPTVIAAGAAVLAAWIGHRSKRAAEQARDFARPTGNGWAAHTTEELRLLRRDLSTVMESTEGCRRDISSIGRAGARLAIDLRQAVDERKEIDADHGARISRLERRIGPA